jgi:hypothetical protein
MRKWIRGNRRIEDGTRREKMKELNIKFISCGINDN